MRTGEISGPRRARARWATILATALTAGVLVAVGAPAQAGTAPVALPSSSRGLKPPVRQPAELDVVPAYVPQSSCSPTEKPGVRKLRVLVLRTYRAGHSGGSVRVCRTADSEHLEGRAWDWMLDPEVARDRKAAADFLAWLTRDGGANARRLGVMYVIYKKRIWASYRAQDGWRPSWGHEDHIHVSLSWDGAQGRTSFWRGRALLTQDLGPCTHFRGTYSVLRSTRRVGECEVAAVGALRRVRLATKSYGTTGRAVRTAQRLLHVRRTGTFDGRTWRAVRRYQQRHDLPVTGAMDAATWASLAPTTVRRDAGAGLTPGSAARLGRTQYADRRLAKGRSIGREVLALQVALRMPRADRNGYFGSRTRSAVKRFQKRNGLRATGVVDAATWARLPQR
jgi:peptidoglycan hydrolase-like protein with peptidoglycan-binding domain